MLKLADSVIETFHDSDADLCPGGAEAQVDSPVRVFEDQNHVIHLTTSDPQGRGWQWTGSVTGFTNNPKTATLDCTSIMNGYTGNNDPAAFDQKTFIQGFYFDNPTVYAYGHEDYYGTRTLETGCHNHRVTPDDGLPRCWYSAIAVWKATVPATGTHLDFAKDGDGTRGDHVAIFPHVRYPGHPATPTAGWIGYGTPSNIVRGRRPDGTLDGYWYMFAYTNSGYAQQSKGVCLFRSDDPTDRTSWNGNPTAPAFTQHLVDPYTGTNTPCAVVNATQFTSYVRSVQWHKPSRHYIAVFRDGAGIRYATSTDLLTWNDSLPLLTATRDEGDYPVIVDFDGGDWGDDNFDRIHDNGRSYLFYRKSFEAGHTRITRRLIEVTNYAADPPGSGNPG
ncbi:MAG TPA: hypothetical protein VIP77_22775 [Jiangellaceae bacterium]